MIRAQAETKDGRRLVILGLSGENITRLMAKEPIVVDLAELGVPGGAVVSIIAARTEADILKDLAPFIGASTRITEEAG